MGKSGKPLHFKGSSFHKVIPDHMIMGGDITVGDGTGGESVYGEKFPDELYMAHLGPGSLYMTNEGRPHTNGSQFFLSTEKTRKYDCKHVLFGKVKSGMDVVKKIEGMGNVVVERIQPVVIANCGQC